MPTVSFPNFVGKACKDELPVIMTEAMTMIPAPLDPARTLDRTSCGMDKLAPLDVFQSRSYYNQTQG
jgi:hypothetical protein